MILSCSVSSEKLTVSLSSAERSVTWCRRCSTLWSPSFSCWSASPTGAPLLCILWFNRAQRLSVVRSGESVLTELMCADIWPLQEDRSTKWWLLIPRPAAVRASTAPRTVTLRWGEQKNTHLSRSSQEQVSFSDRNFFLSLRNSTRQTIRAARLPAASSSNTTTRVSSRGTSSTCRSTTSSLFSGAQTLSSLWGSARWRGPSPPTTGPSSNQETSPCFLCAPASCAPSGGETSCWLYSQWT